MNHNGCRDEADGVLSILTVMRLRIVSDCVINVDYENGRMHLENSNEIHASITHKQNNGRYDG